MNDKQVKAILRRGDAGRHAAGGGLYFRVSSEGTGFWVVRYLANGKRRELTLGRYGTKPGELPLVEAAARAAQLKAEVKAGIDPLAERKRPASISIKTVDDLATGWLKDCEKRLKHPNIPRRIYEKNLAPCFGELALERVSPLDIRQAIECLTSTILTGLTTIILAG